MCGIGLRGNETLKEQLSAQPKFVTDFSTPLLDSLSRGLNVKNVPPYLEVLFKPSIQAYLISWFKYEPAEELAKLSIPSLVIQGTNDIQIKVADAQHLAAKSKLAQLLLIEKMNHLFRLVEGDRAANLATYNQPTLPISEELVEKVGAFVLKKK
ncbi:MAG: alpha/beta hydrolase [Haliscomenobacter sp.]|nr:alpha/beta hydrolase [Haliscomenobacter sp.]MBK9488754.1 alpha/beta hydrolase [Haliscomenobacter sp.]